jgi:hypothetical protein
MAKGLSNTCLTEEDVEGKEPIDMDTVFLESCKLALGTRIAVHWTSPVFAWYGGEVVEHESRLEAGQQAVIYRVRYDDGETVLEDFRYIQARRLPPAGGDVWRQLEVMCALSGERLTRPASLTGCLHMGSCNFESLKHHLRQGARVCPVVSCPVKARLRDINLDTKAKHLVPL